MLKAFFLARIELYGDRCVSPLLLIVSTGYLNSFVAFRLAYFSVDFKITSLMFTPLSVSLTKSLFHSDKEVFVLPRLVPWELTGLLMLAGFFRLIFRLFFFLIVPLVD